MPFEKGQSGNPAGRPRGSRGRATMALQDMLARDAESIAPGWNKVARIKSRARRRRRWEPMSQTLIPANRSFRYQWPV